MREYSDSKRSFQEITDLFNETYTERKPISKSNVCRTVQTYQDLKDEEKHHYVFKMTIIHLPEE